MMKRIILAALLMMLCVSFVSCDGVLEGIGDESVLSETTASLTVPDTLPPETEPPLMSVCVDWMDFIRVNGVVYDGGWENREVDESRIGEKLGEILYTVKSYYESEEELNQADKRDFTAAFRPIGSEIFSLKDDANSIAVLDGGKYYLYSLNFSLDFAVNGRDSIAEPLNSDNIVISNYDQLCEVFGGEENLPMEIKTRYDGDALDNITLIIVYLEGNNGGVEYGISGVTKIGSDIRIDAVRFEAEHGDEAIHIWTFCIEIDKTAVNNLEVNVNRCLPLKDDISLEIGSVPSNITTESLELYGGTPVTNKYAAEEIARGAYDYSIGEVTVRFDPTYNYWMVTHIRMPRSGTFGGHTVIRAADGKIIEQYDVGIEFPA